MPTDFLHRLVGRGVVYRDPYKAAPEQGTITSVNEEAGLVFVRYGLGSTSAATRPDERLTFLNGGQVRLGDRLRRDPPYPFCRHPAKCIHGHCESEWVCND